MIGNQFHSSYLYAMESDIEFHTDTSLLRHYGELSIRRPLVVVYHSAFLLHNVQPAPSGQCNSFSAIGFSRIAECYVMSQYAEEPPV